jgi:hypothetical protein
MSAVEAFQPWGNLISPNKSHGKKKRRSSKANSTVIAPARMVRLDFDVLKQKGWTPPEDTARKATRRFKTSLASAVSTGRSMYQCVSAEREVLVIAARDSSHRSLRV